MISRRMALLGGGSLLAGCGGEHDMAQALRQRLVDVPGGWVGAGLARGHALREPGAARFSAAPASDAANKKATRYADVLVIGAGIAGLSAARALLRSGIDDVHVLELEDSAGGNSRGHHMANMACPLGAHYLPLPGPQAHEVSDWLHEIGLLHSHYGRSQADERHLCHSPQERLFFQGAWHEGLLPPAAPGSASRAQYRRFAAAVAQAQGEVGFSLPSQRAGWTTSHQALDSQTFATWLEAQGLNDPLLRSYLDYACRDDYGAGADAVSAWAGLHYFASRHGFHAPGDGPEGAEREAVLTWPEGNAWLSQRLAAALGAERLHAGRTVWRVDEGRDGVQVQAWQAQADAPQLWSARAVVLAVPLFIAARLLSAPPAALQQVTQVMRYAPWLVANLQLDAPLLDRPGGAPPSWDNVIHASPGLGYVDAMHQSLRSVPGATVLTAYWALPEARRADLAGGDWRPWSASVVQDLAQAHPDLAQRLQRVDLMRYGHAMAIPTPGLRGHPALAALVAARASDQGRIHFAHSDLSAYSVFEEAFTHGHRAAQAVLRRLGVAPRR